MAARRLLLVPLALAAGLTSCAKNMQPAADREVYHALDARRARVPEALGTLDVEAADVAAQPARDLKHVTVDLETALRLGAKASREYLAKREEVYLRALAYTGQKHVFETTSTAGLTAATTDDGTDGSASATPTGSISKTFESGAALVLKLTTDFLKTFGGDPITTARTVLSSDLFLPLGRAGGVLVVREPLTQAEHDMLYALRSFARYQQTFAVGIATSFYRVLEAKQTLQNEEVSHKSLELVYERAKSFGPEGAGRLPDYEVDRARQDLLQAEERRVIAGQVYESTIDRLKTELGIPMSAQVTVAEGSIEALVAAGLVPPRADLATAVGTALSRRLDLENARDERLDAERKVLVAARALGADFDLTLGADLVGPDDRPYDVSAMKPVGRTGLAADLPLDRVAERNTLRAARILAVRARRAVEGFEDQVTAEVRDAWRSLEQAKESYAIQKEGLRLAARRVESANLNLQAGNATTRDVLDAEDDRIRAANALTAALVSYAIARLEYESAAGTLRPDAVVPHPTGAAPAAKAPTPPALPGTVPAAVAPPLPGTVPAAPSK